MKHLTSLLNLSVDDVHAILAKAHELKAGWKRGERPALLQGCYLTQVFEKPSLRTRVSFDAAMAQLGGTGNFLSGTDIGLSTGRESLADIARVISGYSDAVVLRTFSQKLIEDFATHSRCSVINGLSDDDHPCQALTDIFTLQEMWGDVRGKRLVFVGDGNNVAASLAMITSMLGMSMTVCAPRDFELEESLLQAIRLEYPAADITQTVDLTAAMSIAPPGVEGAGDVGKDPSKDSTRTPNARNRSSRRTPHRRRRLNPYSATMPASLATAAHLRFSASTSSSNCRGGPPTTSIPAFASRALTSAASRILLIAALRVSTTSLGVPPGATMPPQELAS